MDKNFEAAAQEGQEVETKRPGDESEVKVKVKG